MYILYYTMYDVINAYDRTTYDKTQLMKIVRRKGTVPESASNQMCQCKGPPKEATAELE